MFLMRNKKTIFLLRTLTKVLIKAYFVGTQKYLSNQILYKLPNCQGARWLSGKVLDWRPRGWGFKPHQPHCVVVLGQDTLINSSLVLTGSTQEDPFLFNCKLVDGT